MTAGQQNINIKNRRARFDYEFIEEYTAGMVLVGTEIKSIREGKAGLADAYCYFVNRELYVKNLYISEYSYGSHNNHEPRCERKLLLNRKELRKLERSTREKGLTIIPIRLFLNTRGLAKLRIALARGKRKYDKRESIKQKDHKREMDRMRKRH